MSLTFDELKKSITDLQSILDKAEVFSVQKARELDGEKLEDGGDGYVSFFKVPALAKTWAVNLQYITKGRGTPITISINEALGRSIIFLKAATQIKGYEIKGCDEAENIIQRKEVDTTNLYGVLAELNNIKPEENSTNLQQKKGF